MLKHPELLGEGLKCDFLCDLFETYDVEVAYVYDRSNEGVADEYRATIPDLGLGFVFDEGQKLVTLFVELVEIKTFCPLHAVAESTPVLDSKAQVVHYATTQNIVSKEGSAVFLGESRDWVRLEYDSYSAHYEFVDSALSMITFQVVGDRGAVGPR